MPEDEAKQVHEDEAHGDEEQPQRGGLRKRLGRLLNQRELAEDTREVLGGMWDLSDRAKTEAVRMVAREVRHYLDELKLMDDVKDIVKNHSLEVRMSLNLKPLGEVEEAPADPPPPRQRAAETERVWQSPEPAPAREASPTRPAARDEPTDIPATPDESDEAPAHPTDEEPA